MKRIIITTILFLSFFTIYAQEKISYHTNIGKIQFEISEKEVYTEFSLQDANKAEVFVNKKFQKINPTSAIIELDNLTGIFTERKQQLKTQLPNLIKVEPVLIFTDGVKQIATGEINLKLKKGYKISEITKQYSFEIIQLSITSNFFTLSNTAISTDELFKIVDKLQKDYRVEFAEPNFIRLLKPFTNDPFFNSQWAIKNQGYLGGTIGADMKVEQAWNIATGSATKVAIIDEGVDLTHPDLQPNLLGGFDATGNNSNGAPNNSLNDAHGTACAGIVAAVANNTSGISGVAYNSNVIPVRIAYSNGYPLGDIRRAWVTNDNWIASGINWAWQNGADVLSNSWGGGSYSNTIETAITNAVTNGRNGKGCVVLFASGNNNSAVSFPATLGNVIAVGASSMCDQRKSPTSCDGESWGGNFGTGLDIMAPGVKIYTTDIHGSAGYNSGDYRADFNGTSSACPNAAAVVALILSVNSNLTGQQARNILESSCDKVGGYSYQSNVVGQPNGTWSNDAGYGRVNANAAICAAVNFGLDIIGDGTVCTTSNNYTIPNLPAGATVQWNTSPSDIVTINSPNSSQTTISKNDNGIITLTATLSNICGGGTIVLSKNITVGVPTTLTGLFGNYPQTAVVTTNDGSNEINSNEPTYVTFTSNEYIAPGQPGIEFSNMTLLQSSQNFPANPYQWQYIKNSSFGQLYLYMPEYSWAYFQYTLPNACGDGTFYLYFQANQGDYYRLSPNPANDIVTVQVDEERLRKNKAAKSTEQDIREIDIVDKMGNILQRKTFGKGVRSASLNTSALRPDIYVVKIFNGKTWKSLQLLKQ